MIKATISRASLAKVAKGINADAEKIRKQTQAELASIARDGKAHAEELLKKAKYDGAPEEDAQIILVPESGWKWEILMAGPGAASIEYGATGQKQKHDYWFFSAKGRGVTLKAGGAHAHYTRYIRSEVTKVDYGSGKIKFLDVRDDPLGSRPKRLIPEGFKAVKGEKSGDAVKVSRFIPLPGQSVNVRKNGEITKRQAGYGLEDVEKPDSYITKGNEPNKIVEKTFEYMASEVDKIAK